MSLNDENGDKWPPPPPPEAALAIGDVERYGPVAESSDDDARRIGRLLGLVPADRPPLHRSRTSCRLARAAVTGSTLDGSSGNRRFRAASDAVSDSVSPAYYQCLMLRG